MLAPQPIDIKEVTGLLVAAHPELPGADLARYLSEIARWNTRAGLISRRNTGSVLERLVGQSARMWQLLSAGGDEPESAVDVGTGGGFPGVIWKLACPRLRLLLIERKPRKVTFLRRLKALMGWREVEVFDGDAQVAATLERYRRAFVVAATLAVGPPSETGPLVGPFLSEDGIFATVTPSGTAPPPQAGELTLVQSLPHEWGTVCLYR